METLITYDSAKGDAGKVAKAICSGIKQMGFTDVNCKAADKVTAADLQRADVWIMGSPSGFLAGRRIIKVIGGAPRDSNVKGFAFDTRLPGANIGPSEKIAMAMSAKGVDVMGKTYFSLGPGNALIEGEEELAVAYGRNLVNRFR
ncbi:MAG: hypothetical protein GX307_00040 [Euryarchaeota archaeon]|nr:hypothetical protein [Euryarchaeota archaeon]